MRVEHVDWGHPASIALRAAQRAEIDLRYGTRDSEPGPAPTRHDITAFFVACGDTGVRPESRGTGVSTATRFYTREGFLPIPNFGYYVGADASLCFAKDLQGC